MSQRPRPGRHLFKGVPATKILSRTLARRANIVSLFTSYYCNVNNGWPYCIVPFQSATITEQKNTLTRSGRSSNSLVYLEVMHVVADSNLKNLAVCIGKRSFHLTFAVPEVGPQLFQKRWCDALHRLYSQIQTPANIKDTQEPDFSKEGISSGTIRIRQQIQRRRSSTPANSEIVGNNKYIALCKSMVG